MDEITKRVALLLFLLVSLVYAGEESTGNNKNDDDDNDDDNNNNDDRERMNEFLEFWTSHKFKSEIPAKEGLVLHDTAKIMDWKGCYETDLSTINDPTAYTIIPTDYDYQLLVEAYLHAMTNQHNSTHHRGGKYLREPSVKEYNPSHWEVPIEVRSIPHVGRGLFAIRDIKKGTCVGWSRNTLFFYSEEAYRDFLAYLVLKKSKLFCDHFLWFYGYKVPTTDDPDDFTVGLDADSSSLINSGDWFNENIEDDYYDDDSYYNSDAEEEDDDDDDDDDEDFEEEDVEAESESKQCVNGGDQCVDAAVENEIGDTDEDEEDAPIGRTNVGEYQNTKNGKRKPTTDDGCLLYALRDIRAGEELLMSYSDFSAPEGFRIIGLDH